MEALKTAWELKSGLFPGHIWNSRPYLANCFFSAVFIGEPLGPRVSEAVETPLLNGCLLLQLVCGQINLW